MAAESSAGATPSVPRDWHSIDWKKAHVNVRRLQARIVQAMKAGKWGKVKALQHLLTRSFSAKALAVKPTVSLGVTCAVVYTYGCGDGRISPTRCAVIDAGLDDRYRPRRADRTPPAGVGSTRSALAAASRPGSTIDPGGFRRPKTTPPSAPTPCGDASLARCAPDKYLSKSNLIF